MSTRLSRRARAGIAAAALGLAGAWALPRAYATVDNTYEQLKLLVDILDYIKENYVEDVQSKDLIYGAARGMVKTLDPFSQFMDPDLHKDIKTETEGQFGGLGIRIGMRDDWLTVITPLPDTPAFRAGVLPQDRIIKIEGESTKGISLIEAVKKLRGKPGSKVAMTVARMTKKDDKEDWITKDVELVREVIKIQSVQQRLLDNHIGFVKINEFSAHTAADVREAIDALKKAGAKALVLDLRNNPGGLLTSAVDVASFFLDEQKLIVYTQGRHADNRQDFRAGEKGRYAQLPMVVLVNAGSASGSEIVAGALQDHRRAVILGSKTFGKASVQSVIPLSDGSGLRLTVAKYYTPLGRSIQRDEKSGKGGIAPDIEIEVAHEIDMKLQAQAEQVYEKGKNSHSVVPDDKQVQDGVLDRATELLRAREILSSLQVNDG